MSADSIVQFTIQGLLPVVLAAAIYILQKHTPFGRLPRIWAQVIIGIAFGGLAVLSTEFGVPASGAVINVRDASPLIAGLGFGAPAGIIAGVIGGVERWFSVYWGAGEYTRLACTIGTVLAGLIGAAARKFMLDDKRATPFFGGMIGITTEVIHMLLIFITHPAEVKTAFYYVRACSAPMITANAVSVLLAMFVLGLISRETLFKPRAERRITQTFQTGLLITIFIGFILTTIFTYLVQDTMARNIARNNLTVAVLDVSADIENASDRYLIDIADNVAKDVTTSAVSRNNLYQVAFAYNVAEVNLVDRKGIITHSNIPENVGFDMSSGDQSGEFMVLIDGFVRTYAQPYQPISRDAKIYRKYAGVTLPDGGFVQVGFDTEQFHTRLSNDVEEAAENRHIGDQGFVLILDEVGEVRSSPWEIELDTSSLIQKVESDATEEYSLYEGLINKDPYVFVYTNSEGYYIIACQTTDEAFYNKNVAVYITVFMEILIFAALFVTIYMLVKHVVVNNIEKVNEGLAQITAGNLDEEIEVRTNKEFATLSDDINSTVDTLKVYIADASARIDRELDFARRIQEAALPSVFPPYPGRKDFDIFAGMFAAKEVGGDFYDFYLIDNQTLVFLVADVSGKGIPGAMFMMTSKTLLKSLVESGLPVEEAFTQANDELCANNDADMFVTAWMGMLDLRSGKLEYVNAGHNPPLIKKADGEFEYLRAARPNLVLASMEGIKYRRNYVMLSPGDTIFLYTDGVTEATAAGGVLYGEERLQQRLNSCGTLPVHEMCDCLKAGVDEFVGEEPQFDDITMLAVRLNFLQTSDTITLIPGKDSVSTVTAFLDRQLDQPEITAKTANKVRISADEVYTNIVSYSGATEAQITCQIEGDALLLVFKDNGRPFNPLSEAPEPDVTLSAEERSIGGLGVFMVKKLARNVAYKCDEDGCNVLAAEFSL